MAKKRGGNLMDPPIENPEQAYITEMEDKLHRLEAEAAKLQADRAKLKREINFKDNVIHIAAEREAKLVELVREAYCHGCNMFCPLDIDEFDDEWKHSDAKRRLDEITGGDAERGN